MQRTLTHIIKFHQYDDVVYIDGEWMEKKGQEQEQKSTKKIAKVSKRKKKSSSSRNNNKTPIVSLNVQNNLKRKAHRKILWSIGMWKLVNLVNVCVCVCPKPLPPCIFFLF